jgi:phosphomevalonate kinase
LSSEAGAEGSTNPTAVEGLHSADPQGSSDGGLGIARPAPLELPPRLEMVLADVDTGSNTPSLVGKVMAWRKAKPEWGECIVPCDTLCPI